MVTEEGGEAHTINLCKRWYNERQVRQGKPPAKAAEWREKLSSEKLFVASCGRFFWDGTIYEWNVGMLHREKSMGLSGLSGCRKREAGRHTWSVAIRVSLQGSLGAN